MDLARNQTYTATRWPGTLHHFGDGEGPRNYHWASPQKWGSLLQKHQETISDGAPYYINTYGLLDDDNVEFRFVTDSEATWGYAYGWTRGGRGVNFAVPSHVGNTPTSSHHPYVAFNLNSDFPQKATGRWRYGRSIHDYGIGFLSNYSRDGSRVGHYKYDGNNKIVDAGAGGNYRLMGIGNRNVKMISNTAANLKGKSLNANVFPMTIQRRRIWSPILGDIGWYGWKDQTKPYFGFYKVGFRMVRPRAIYDPLRYKAMNDEGRRWLITRPEFAKYFRAGQMLTFLIFMINDDSRNASAVKAQLDDPNSFIAKTTLKLSPDHQDFVHSAVADRVEHAFTRRTMPWSANTTGDRIAYGWLPRAYVPIRLGLKLQNLNIQASFKITSTTVQPFGMTVQFWTGANELPVPAGAISTALGTPGSHFLIVSAVSQQGSKTTLKWVLRHTASVTRVYEGTSQMDIADGGDIISVTAGGPPGFGDGSRPTDRRYIIHDSVYKMTRNLEFLDFAVIRPDEASDKMRRIKVL